MKEYPGNGGLNNKSSDFTVHEIWRYLVSGLVQWFNYIIRTQTLSLHPAVLSMWLFIF